VTAIVVGGLVLLVGLAFVWSRVASARSERRSMENYGHALGVLGDVARRSERSASVRIVPREETGHAHVRTEDHEGDFPTAVSPTGEHEVLRPGRPSFRLEHDLPAGELEHPPAAIAAGSDLHFDDDGEHLGGEARPAGRPRPAGVATPDDLRRQALHRRVGTTAAAAVAVLALVLVGIQLTHGSKRAGSRPPASGTHAAGAHRHTTPPPSTVTTTTAPKLLTPTSSSPSLVSFDAPSGSYHLTFTDPGDSDSWLGVKSSTDSAIWLWMSTLTPGATQTYTANGPIVVDLGAPRYVSLTVNGIPAQLPDYSLPYYLSFTSSPSSGSA